MAKMRERKEPPSQEPVVAPAKPVANKLDISPLFKLVSVVIAASTSFCLLLSMLFTLRYPDPPAIQSSAFFSRLAKVAGGTAAPTP